MLPNITQLIIEQSNKMHSNMAIYYYVGSVILFDCGCLGDVIIYILMNQSLKIKFLLHLREPEQKQIPHGSIGAETLFSLSFLNS